MATKTRIVYHGDGSKTVNGTCAVLHYDDSERLQIEGSQGDRVMRGYRDLESSGRLRRHTMQENISTVKRAWADEQTARFK